MKIIKIVVDELPENCGYCEYIRYHVSTGLFEVYEKACSAFGHVVRISDTETKTLEYTHKCPLETDYDKSCHCIKCDPDGFEKYYQDDEDEKE